jgi:hypothetical protein
MKSARLSHSEEWRVARAFSKWILNPATGIKHRKQFAERLGASLS